MIKNIMVVKSNRLVEARYKLNLNEQKIILYAVGKLDRNKNKFNILELDIREFTELIGTTHERYTEIREIVTNLMAKQVRIDTLDRDLVANWISSIEYIKDTGKIELEFSEKLVPYLLQLKEQFTTYELKNVLNLKNKYAIRIYELLKQYENIKFREFELEKFKKMIGCESNHSRFNNFRDRVLEPAKQELDKHTDISFEYEKVEKGRKVTGIKFTIKGKIDKQKALLDAIYINGEIEEIINKSGLENEKFSTKQVMQLYEVACKKTESGDICTYEYIKINYKNMIDKGTVRNKFGYLKKALEDDYASAAAQIQIEFLIEPEATA